MTDDNQLLWEAYLDETIATPQNIKRARSTLRDSDLSTEDRQIIIDVLQHLESQVETDDAVTLKQKILYTLKKIHIHLD